MHPSVHRCTIYNSQGMEYTIIYKIDKQYLIITYSGKQFLKRDYIHTKGTFHAKVGIIKGGNGKD